jgi:Spy/CpxP family protein refolding chaperone
VRRATALLAVVAVFLTGVLVGVLATHVVYLRQIRQPGGLAAVGTRLAAADLRRRLDLTPEQQREVEAILADTRREAAALRAEITPRAAAILTRSQARIASVLTPEQRAEFERTRRRQRERLRRFLGGG